MTSQEAPFLLPLPLMTSLHASLYNILGTVFEQLQVAQVALNHLKQARDLLPSVPKEARPFMLPAVSSCCQLYRAFCCLIHVTSHRGLSSLCASYQD